jgi:hypothetical protein
VRVNTRLLLSLSAVILGLAGIGALFLPQEIAAALGMGGGRRAALLVQLAGAMLFSFAMANWMARGSLFGGIYNRPLAVANVTHFAIGAITLVKTALAGWNLAVAVAAAVYTLFAIAFFAVLGRSPVFRPPDAT